jgi:dephospho-CoA kinase
MRVYAYTGGIACGKSQLAQVFIKNNIPVIDADKLAHELYEPGSPIYKRIIEHFGKEILDRDKMIDRKRLGTIIFSNKQEKVWLEKLVHPEVRKLLWQRVKEKQDLGYQVILVEAALMIESGLHKDFDGVIVISCDPKIQIERVMQRDQIDQVMAQQKIDSQLALDEKIKIADHHIENSADLESAEKQVLELIPKL